MDLILGQFAERNLSGLSDDLLDQFETLLNCPDQTLYSWISGKEPIPEEFDNKIMGLVRKFEFSSH